MTKQHFRNNLMLCHFKVHFHLYQNQMCFVILNDSFNMCLIVFITLNCFLANFSIFFWQTLPQPILPQDLYWAPDRDAPIRGLAYIIHGSFVNEDQLIGEASERLGLRPTKPDAWVIETFFGPRTWQFIYFVGIKSKKNWLCLVENGRFRQRLLRHGRGGSASDFALATLGLGSGLRGQAS